jgi:Rps23 Pro-64 3,4-dihydroxylase Tpa1-like proline 4-hydroxylase
MSTVGAFAAVDSFEIDFAKLDRIAEEKATAYQSADPFPHIVIDDFVNSSLLERVREEVSSSTGQHWRAMDDSFQRKFANANMRDMGPNTRALINFMNGQEILGFLEALTGIEGLVADWQLAGGGMHALRDGGFLNVHADFNYHPHLKLDRRINLLLYLNKEWQPDWGGQLELWDRDMSHCRHSINPEFNRCVIFNTTDRSFHGNPNPVKAPDGRPRLSLAFYYYSNGRPNDELSATHFTLFRKPREHEMTKERARRLARRLLPPILFEGIDRRRNR